MKQNRGVIVIGSVVAVLLVAVAIIGVLILNSINNPMTEEERIAACMEEKGYALDETPNDDFTWEGLREASAACGLDSE
ncbi:hypothetical protein V8Z69_07465 [Microbacterium aurugineum]|uniref:hypothetical protein n=1 Tax=Microbacterium TaxID=33882 RepID=UPI0021144B23|nr:hypothetical protein [Microbacterium sp. J1-1]UUE19898.1 hypothetical protein LRQ07_14020 [Microbacterium sp. J1-1]